MELRCSSSESTASSHQLFYNTSYLCGIENPCSHGFSNLSTTWNQKPETSIFWPINLQLLGQSLAQNGCSINIKIFEEMKGWMEEYTPEKISYFMQLAFPSFCGWLHWLPTKGLILFVNWWLILKVTGIAHFIV